MNIKEKKTKESQNLGKTIGEPKLSKEAQKYYDKLKKKSEGRSSALPPRAVWISFLFLFSAVNWLLYENGS